MGFLQYVTSISRIYSCRPGIRSAFLLVGAMQLAQPPTRHSVRGCLYRIRAQAQWPSGGPPYLCADSTVCRRASLSWQSLTTCSLLHRLNRRPRLCPLHRFKTWPRGPLAQAQALTSGACTGSMSDFIFAQGHGLSWETQFPHLHRLNLATGFLFWGRCPEPAAALVPTQAQCLSAMASVLGHSTRQIKG